MPAQLGHNKITIPFQWINLAAPASPILASNIISLTGAFNPDGSPSTTRMSSAPLAAPSLGTWWEIVNAYFPIALSIILTNASSNRQTAAFSVAIAISRDGGNIFQFATSDSIDLAIPTAPSAAVPNQAYLNASGDLVNPIVIGPSDQLSVMVEAKIDINPNVDPITIGSTSIFVGYGPAPSKRQGTGQPNPDFGAQPCSLTYRIMRA